MTANSCFQILFRNVQRLKTTKEIGKVLGLCTFLNKIWKDEFDVISGKRHILDLLKGCIGCSLTIRLYSDKYLAPTITNAYSVISTSWSSGLLCGR